jgi:hypothetical protein
MDDDLVPPWAGTAHDPHNGLLPPAGSFHDRHDWPLPVAGRFHDPDERLLPMAGSILGRMQSGQEKNRRLVQLNPKQPKRA